MKQLRLCAAVVMSALAVSAAGHPATERYIPMGYWTSIGVENSYIGDVTDVASDGATLAYQTEGRRTTIRIDDETRIYIDRSHLGKKSLRGTREDLRPGRRMEIKLRTDASGVAEWIKVRE